MKKVYIEWEDCFSIDRWLPVEQAIEETKSNILCFTIGFFINEDESGITICHTFQAESQVCGILKIPKKCIIKLDYL
jgi:hypothetical protein